MGEQSHPSICLDPLFPSSACCGFWHTTSLHVLWDLHLSVRLFLEALQVALYLQIHNCHRNFMHWFCIRRICWFHLLVLGRYARSCVFLRLQIPWDFLSRPSCYLNTGTDLFLPFWSAYILFPFLSVLWWLEFAAFCWIAVVRVDILAYFSRLEESIYSFHHWAGWEIL